MLELSSARKNKVNLADYNCQQDIGNRMLMADFSTFEHNVLQEILFSPLKVSLKKLSRNMGCEEEDLTPILQKLMTAGLLSFQDDTITVDKDRRKYFEFQIARYDPDFRPDMEFLQGVLRKVPIHLLPSWYSIPRTSNNIFESIVEKYLLTPQIFQRYLMDLNFGDPIISGIIQDVISVPNFKVSSSDLISKYNLSRRDFEEILLLLEFNFVCCLIYEKEEEHWIESVTLFHEWREYLLFLKATEAPSIPEENVIRDRERDFAFIEDLSALLLLVKKSPTSLQEIFKQYPSLLTLSTQNSKTQIYIESLIEKLCLVQLAEQKEGHLFAQDGADEWLNLTLEMRALHLYRHPMNRILKTSLSLDLTTERNIREAEKSVKRVKHGQWVFFDDFIRGILVTLSEKSVVMLKRNGKHWRYTLPCYTEEEISLVHATLFEWLFEMGMVVTGISEGKECFSVTPFGRFFFED